MAWPIALKGERDDKRVFAAPLPCGLLGDTQHQNVIHSDIPKQTQDYIMDEYETTIKRCAHHGDVEGAEQLLRRMRADGHTLPLRVWNLMVNACTQAGDIARAELYVDVMEQSGLGTDLITYNSVINGFANLGDGLRVQHWFRKLLQRGLEPNDVTYGTICKVFARQGNVEKIERIMCALDAEGKPLNEYFYALFICACGTSMPPCLERIEGALQDLVRRGLRPQSVRSALVRAVGHERARQLLRRLRRPDEQTAPGLSKPSTAFPEQYSSNCSSEPFGRLMPWLLGPAAPGPHNPAKKVVSSPQSPPRAQAWPELPPSNFERPVQAAAAAMGVPVPLSSAGRPAIASGRGHLLTGTQLSALAAPLACTVLPFEDEKAQFCSPGPARSRSWTRSAGEEMLPCHMGTGCGPQGSCWAPAYHSCWQRVTL
jgi:pentatricopeptide repeat protein